MKTCPGTVSSSSNGILVDDVGDYFSKLFPCLIFKVLSAQQRGGMSCCFARLRMSVFSYCLVIALGFGTFYRQNDMASSAARILSLQKSLWKLSNLE